MLIQLIQSLIIPTAAFDADTQPEVLLCRCSLGLYWWTDAEVGDARQEVRSGSGLDSSQRPLR